MSKQRKSGKSDNFGDAGIKHILRSGIKITANEKPVFVQKQKADGIDGGHKCRRENINTKTSHQPTQSSSVNKSNRSCSGKLGTAKTCLENISKTHGSSSGKHNSLRRSPRCKMTHPSDSSCEKDKHDIVTDTKFAGSHIGLKITSRRKNSEETPSKVCSGMKRNSLPAVNLRRHSSTENSSRDLRRRSSPEKPYSNRTERVSSSPDTQHTPKSGRRNSFPSIPLRTSPRRKSPVKYFYGSARSPKRKSKFRIIRRASASPDKSATAVLSAAFHGALTHKSLKGSVVKTRGSISPVKSQPPSMKIEKKSKTKAVLKSGQMSLKTEFKCSQEIQKHGNQELGETSSVLTSLTPQKLGKSTTERELKKITDYWSPKQTDTDTARILRNGRCLDASVSPRIKKISIKQEPVNELENHHQHKDVGHSSINSQGRPGTSVRREIQFGHIVSSCAKRKCDSITGDEDEDDDSHLILRRKKLRSEVKNDELWEGLQIQRFKRLTPKKEKIETQTPPKGNVVSGAQCETSDNGDMYDGDTDTANSTSNFMQCQENVSELDFSNAIVKKERFDDEYEEGCYDFDEMDKTDMNIDNLAQDKETALETDKSDDHDKAPQFIFKSENISEPITKEKPTRACVSTLSPSSKQDPEAKRQPTEFINERSDSKDAEFDDMYGLDGTDFQFQADTSEELEQPNTSTYSIMLDLECDSSISQTIDSERDLEDTFLYYDMPSPSELERSQPAMEFHEYDGHHDSIETKEHVGETMQLKEQSPDFLTNSTADYEMQPNKSEVPDFHNESTDTDAESDTEIAPNVELDTDVKSCVELGSLSSTETHPVVDTYIVRDEITTAPSISDTLSTLTPVGTENEETSPENSSYTRLTTGEEINPSEETETEKSLRKTGSKVDEKYGQDALADEKDLTKSEKTGEKQERETSRDKDAEQLGEQTEGKLVDCGVNESGPNEVTSYSTPIKNRRHATEGTTPKRSARLQERRESTPSKWEDEYVFTLLRRADESKKIGREQRNVRSTQSDVKISDPSQTEELSDIRRDHNIPEKLRENLHEPYSDDMVSASNKTDDSHSDLSPKTSDIKISTQTTGRSNILKSLDEASKGKSSSVSSGEHPPLKIRVKKSADGTTRIVASPSSKSAVLNMCSGNPELVLTPCDKKQKKKDVPMRSLLKPKLVLRKCPSPPSTSKRKRAKQPEVSPDEPDNKYSDRRNKKKKEGRHTFGGIDTSRRQHDHTSAKGERVPLERAGKRKLDDAEDLLKNVLVGKHASILWLSENRRHFLLKHAECTPSEIDAMLSDAWANLGEKEKMKYYQRASGAMRDENKHSNVKSRSRQHGQKDNALLKDDGKMSKKMLRFLSLSPMEQHEELRRWLRFFVYEVSPAEYAKLMADFKETMKDLKENQKISFRASDLEMQALYRKILFQKILDLQDKIVDIYHQKRERQDEIVKEGFDILTKRLIVGDDISFSSTVRSEDLQQVLLDLKLLENERRVAVSGTPLKSKSYENVLEQLQECEQIAETKATSVESCSSAKPSLTSELPEADSRFATELLFNIKHQKLPQFEVFNLERDLDTDRGGCLSKEETDENTNKEIFEKLSNFFNQEALLNHDTNFWAPGLSPGRHASGISSVLTDCLLADQFKMLAQNSSVFGSGVKMLIDPSQLKPFIQERNVHRFQTAPRVVQYPSTLLRYAPSTGDKNQNGYTKRRTPTSKYDKYKTHSLSGHSPVTVHYTGRSRYPVGHSLPRMHQLSQIPRQPSLQTRWRPPSAQLPVTQRPRITAKEHESRYTSIIHRRIQNVEGGTVVQYTASSLGRRPSS